jgi:hypothetical protein
MTDRLMKLYELNEQYHDTKEKRAWLATTFYVAFCLAVFKWTTNIGTVTIVQDHQYTIIGFLFVVFLCVFFFNLFQYRKKRASVKVDHFIAKALSVQKGNDNDQLVKVFDYMHEAHKPRWKRSDKPAYHSTEIHIFVLMFAFFIAQVLIILTA